MSGIDDRDLAAAFEHLRAPRSTARYAERPTLEAAARRTSFASVLASVVAVAVALAGAGTFLALRGLREGGVATTGGAANPPGRAGAAMAYDSTAGLTVMYGGSGAAGKPLADTWLWNGSTWNRAASAGPGPMVAAHMADDPPAGGVLLIGLPAVVEPQVVCATGSGGVTGVGTSTGA